MRETGESAQHPDGEIEAWTGPHTDVNPSWLGEPTGMHIPEPENDPFQLPAQDVSSDRWIPAELHGGHAPWTAPVPARPIRVSRPPRRLAVALPLMVLLAMFTAFFSWVSAEPLWLAVGHGESGTATVTRCVGKGMTQRCVGEFVAADGSFNAANVTMLGGPAPASGSYVIARMVGSHSNTAYTGAGMFGLHLRWAIGFALVLLCGVGVALASGALRLPDRAERMAALGTSFGAPLLVTVGFLAASF